jgi:hypothetical protein
MDKQPKGLIINCDGNNYFQIDASERFMVVLKINGQWVAIVALSKSMQDIAL